ncbi:unnamed protein product [Brugia timori]|uniref:Uncharacterized protein n=1 Tax=Brugia timori TaxID=42155 RepID=A0A0R3QEL1_9BILA|nr:unnamed protein product [Brugia timori]
MAANSHGHRLTGWSETLSNSSETIFPSVGVHRHPMKTGGSVTEQGCARGARYGYGRVTCYVTRPGTAKM